VSRTPQLPLPLGFARGISRAFLVAPCNQVAADTVGAWPRWPGPIVYLAGPPASGKTHLAALWAVEAGAELVVADRLGEAPPTAKYLAVDGLDALTNGEALFHTVNAVMERGGALLVTARAAPHDLRLHLPDLKTRLLGATHLSIGPPDQAFLEKLLVHLAEQAQIAMDPAVAAYCVSRMERTQEAAVNLISALDRRSLSLKGPLSQRLAGEVLDEMFGASRA
jgi:chromosomal replication initiation ATPase DnaA